MFGSFYFCPDGREAAASRQGLHAFDPASTGTVAAVTADLDGNGAAAIRFKGIAKHRGATIIGWGYQDETSPDKPEILRWCKYGDPTTWVPDTEPDTAGFAIVGTFSLTAIAAGAASLMILSSLVLVPEARAERALRQQPPAGITAGR